MLPNRTLGDRALEALEWSLIREALASRTRSPLGGALALRHAPFATPGPSQRLRARVLEGRGLVEQSPVHGYVSGARDVAELLDRASRDGVLDPASLYACGHFLMTVGMLGEELRARAASAPLWAGDFAQAPKTPPVCDKITRSVSSEGSILDTASSELGRLRRLRVEKRAEFEATLTSKLKEWNASGLLQDNFYDQIDGRYVVPVKAEQQSKLGGTLLGRSNTGQSVFIEPAELTVSNNALKEIDLSIRAEEFRILRTLSSEVGGLTPAFLPWIEVVAELDLALAAARLAKDWELHEPKVGEHDGELDLKDIFHPGLKLREVDIIRNYLTLPSGGYGMLISGPNTGGKTVLIKAAALAANMARAGLLVPALPGTRIPHYADVLAFIGDEQNIAAGLSSFSAQIMDMKAVLADERQPMLIIVDEILSSTDPEEASALAQSIIEELIDRGHHVVVTSHFSELSLRCKVHPRVTVAAMEFEAGRPTYRLRLDELGSSHALEVAERLGFPGRLLARARGLLSTAKLDYEKAQAELRKKEQDLELEHEQWLAAASREQQRYKSELREQLEAFKAEAQKKVDEALKAIGQRLETYTRQGVGGLGARAAERLEAAAKDALAELTGKSGEVAKTLGREALEKAALPLVEGATVKVKSMKGSKGTVLEVKGTGAAQKATLQLGNFRVERPADDLEVVAAPQAARPRPLNTYIGFDSGASSARKIDVRGKRYDEAMSEMEHFIDQAFRSGAAQVTVVTGHGTGALKKGLKELLTGLPYVREFRPEREGDDGATLIEFDR